MSVLIPLAANEDVIAVYSNDWNIFILFRKVIKGRNWLVIDVTSGDQVFGGCKRRGICVSYDELKQEQMRQKHKLIALYKVAPLAVQMAYSIQRTFLTKIFYYAIIGR